MGEVPIASGDGAFWRVKYAGLWETLGDGDGGALLLGTLDLVKFFVVRHGQVGEPG